MNEPIDLLCASILLYTENFRNGNFDIFSFDGVELQKLQPDVEQQITGYLRKTESNSEISSSGFALEEVGCEGNDFISFRVEIDQKAPSNRKRLIFGCVATNTLVTKGSNFILIAINQLLEKLSLSMPEKRLCGFKEKVERLQEKLENEKKTGAKAKVITGAVVALTGITLGSYELIKGLRELHKLSAATTEKHATTRTLKGDGKDEH